MQQEELAYSLHTHVWLVKFRRRLMGGAELPKLPPTSKSDTPFGPLPMLRRLKKRGKRRNKAVREDCSFLEDEAGVWEGALTCHQHTVETGLF